MAHFFDFSSDKIDIFLLLIDSSGSMEKDERNVISGLEEYKASFEGFLEANSIAVSISKFDDDFYPGEFKNVREFEINYRTGGATVLFYSIVEAGKYLNQYIKEVTKRTGCIPRATFIVFSDGEPCQDRREMWEAKETIENLNNAGITTVFVAFGNAISSEFGNRLGFVATKEVTNKKVLANFLGVELSKSCKEQSKSMKSLGANFFSKAVNGGNSEEYSQTTAQVLEDDSWMDDV